MEKSFMRKTIITFLVICTLSSSIYSLETISAEARIRRLAIKAENERKLSGIISASFGLIFIGASFSSNIESGREALVGLGLAYLLMGAAQYYIPKGIENDLIALEKMKENTDEDKKEKFLFAEKALKNAGEEGARGRKFGALTLSTLGLGLVSVGEGMEDKSIRPLGLTFALMGLFSYFFDKTDAEREYEEYLKERRAIE